MTTATAQKPITEAEIREALAARGNESSSGSTTPRPGEPKLRAELRGIAMDYAQAIGEAAFLTLETTAAEYGDLSGAQPWRDLRPSEAFRLQSLIDDAIAAAVEVAQAAILDNLTAAALTFAAEYPDAPRAVPEAV
jgi:hypothetical protein